MADITAQEWRDLQTKVNQIAVSVADLAGVVNESVAKIEDLRQFKKDAEGPMWHIKVWGTVGMVLGAAMVIAIGIGARILWTLDATAATREQVAGLKSTVDYEVRDIADLRVAFKDLENRERDIGKELAKHGQEIGRLQGVIETLVKENKKLSVLIEKGRINFASLKTFHGTLVYAKGDTIHFMSNAKVQKSFTIGTNTRILVNGQEVDISELYNLKAVPIHVYQRDDDPNVILIEVERPKAK